MKNLVIGLMALVFGGKKGDEWEPTKQDYAVFFAIIFITAVGMVILKIT